MLLSVIFRPRIMAVSVKIASAAESCFSKGTDTSKPKYNKTWTMPEQAGVKAERKTRTQNHNLYGHTHVFMGLYMYMTVPQVQVYVMAKIRSFQVPNILHLGLYHKPSFSNRQCCRSGDKVMAVGQSAGTAQTGNTGTQEGETQPGTNPG